ncbi:hypothetical protein TNCV_4965791, partial [Trichonephila clavipes]
GFDLGSLSLSAQQQRENLFSAPTRDISLPRSSHVFANSATDVVEFRGCKRSTLQQRSFSLSLVSHVNGAGTRFRPPTYHFHRADWDQFTRLAIISGTMVQNWAVDEAVLNVTEAIRMLLMQPFPNIHLESCANHGGTLPCQQQAKRNKGGRGGIFRRGTPPLIIS